MPAMTMRVLACLLLCAASAWCADTVHRLPLVITSDLPFPNTPLDPLIDFGRVLADAGASGRLDPNSIQAVDMDAGETVPHALSPEFAYGDKGRVCWVVRNPAHRRYEIRFRTAAERPPPHCPRGEKYAPSNGHTRKLANRSKAEPMGTRRPGLR